MSENRNTFRGSLGFILAAASSAVGLGNIWRFPYLAAKDGGGLFVFVYLALMVTFGFSLLITELAIGRLTRQGPLTAYSNLKKGWKPLGVLSCLIPAIIMPYYSVIGGWVLKYLLVFITGQGPSSAKDGYFTGFITSQWEPIILFIIFLALAAFIIYLGVNKGIETSSKIIMPVLLVLIIFISIFSLTIKHTDANNQTRTGLQGLYIFCVPNFDGMTVKGFFTVVMDAMGQLFYSLSVAMGIMITYGSYLSRNAKLKDSVTHIELFDTIVAFLAGVMIIPAVYVFMGAEGMKASGPGLMFISLPKVFLQMGFIGNIIGAMFFAMVLFAALSSAVSVMEAVVSSIMDQFHISRIKATIIEGSIALVAGIIVCLGYNKLYFEIKLPNGSIAQILDIMDYVSNNILMPIVAIATCILVSWVLKIDLIIEEFMKNGILHFRRQKLYILMVRYIAPTLLFLLLLKSAGIITFI